MGQGLSFPPGVHIVVVGGGYAGNTLCAGLLDHHANFTLIDARDFFHHNVASVRSIVIPELTNQTLIPYRTTYGSHFRQGKVVGVDPRNKTVKLQEGQEVNYDILVLASGTSGPFPGKMGDVSHDEALGLYREYADRVRASSRIVIVGGGAVGVEIAGEISTEYPDKEITIIHGGRHLVWNYLTAKFHGKVRSTLDNLGVNVLLEEKVENLPEDHDAFPYEIRTDKGRHITADLVIPCTGLVVNSDAYSKGLGDHVDERNALRINRHFQVDDQEDIFAVGDCCASRDPWTAYLAQEQAKYVLKNISRKLSGHEMVHYPGNVAPVRLVLTVGRHHAFGELKGGWSLPDWFCRYVKADLLISRYWQSMRQQMPRAITQ